MRACECAERVFLSLLLFLGSRGALVTSRDAADCIPRRSRRPQVSHTHDRRHPRAPATMSGSTAAATNPAASSPARANADAPAGDGLGAAAKAKLKGLLAAAFGSSVTTVRIDVQAPRLTRERRQRKAYGGWGDAPARADGDDGFTRGGITSHNFSVEQTRLQVKQNWETGLFEQRQTGGGTVIKSRLDLGAGLDVGLLRAEVVRANVRSATQTSGTTRRASTSARCPSARSSPARGSRSPTPASSSPCDWRSRRGSSRRTANAIRSRQSPSSPRSSSDLPGRARTCPRGVWSSTRRC